MLTARNRPIFACLCVLAGLASIAPSPSSARRHHRVASAPPSPSPNASSSNALPNDAPSPASLSPRAESARPSAAAMYARVREAVNALPMPAYVAFTLEDASTTKYRLQQERIRMLVRTSDGRAVVRVLRDIDGNVVGNAEPSLETTTDVPEILIYRAGDFPLADFGLRRVQIRPGIFDAEGTPDPVPSSDLRVLTTVTAVSASYRLTDLGDDDVDGRPTYHLGLKPIRDPGHHVLRQMWIDPATSLPVRYVVDRYVGARGASFHYLVTVNAALASGVLTNVDSDGRYDYHTGLVFRVKGEGKWKVSNVAFPADVPAWAFDTKSFRRHAAEPLPALATP